ncbi:hypothetical protein T484DRAFT_1788505 [Baffinella frigidus]|nr:hypothetical protein T484DRAFT_1788505 [Cryptophyta sp. CCMP2293]
MSLVLSSGPSITYSPPLLTLLSGVSLPAAPGASLLLERGSRYCSDSFTARGVEAACVAGRCSARFWPGACCPFLTCSSHGAKPYQGACACKCQDGWTNRDCSGKQSHIAMSLSLDQGSVSGFDTSGFGSVVTELFELGGGAFELQEWTVEAPARRAAIGETTGGMRIAFRLLTGGEDETLAVFERVQKSMEGGSQTSLAGALGEAGVSSGGVALVSIRSFDASGRVLCDDQPETFCSFIKSTFSPTADEASLLPLWVSVGVIGGMFLCCAIALCLVVTKYRPPTRGQSAFGYAGGRMMAREVKHQLDKVSRQKEPTRPYGRDAITVLQAPLARNFSIQGGFPGGVPEHKDDNLRIVGQCE